MFNKFKKVSEAMHVIIQAVEEMKAMFTAIEDAKNHYEKATALFESAYKEIV